MFLMGFNLGFNCNLIVMINIIELSSLIFFFLHEAKAENPIPLSIFRNRDLNGDLIYLQLPGVPSYVVNTYLPMWAQALLGMSALMGGMTLIPNSVVEIAASQTVATIQEKLELLP